MVGVKCEEIVANGMKFNTFECENINIVQPDGSHNVYIVIFDQINIGEVRQVLKMNLR